MTSQNSFQAYRIILEGDTLIRFGVSQRSLIAKEGDWICESNGENIYRHYYPKKRDKHHFISIPKILTYCLAQIPGMQEPDLDFCLAQLKLIEQELPQLAPLSTVSTGKKEEHSSFESLNLWENFLHASPEDIKRSEAKYLAAATKYIKAKAIWGEVIELLRDKYNISLEDRLAKNGVYAINLNWMDNLIFSPSFVQYSQAIVNDNEYFSKKITPFDNTVLNQGFFDLFDKKLSNFDENKTYFLPLTAAGATNSTITLFTIKGLVGNILDFTNLSEQLFFMSEEACQNFLTSSKGASFHNTMLLKIERAEIKEIIIQKNMRPELLPEIERMQVLLEKSRVNNHLGDVGIKTAEKIVNKV